MKCNETCRLFGMYQFLSGIEDNVVLIHSVIACHFATMMHSLHKKQNTLNSCSTVINDKDVVFGGETSLEYALQQVVDLYHPKSITVLTGCVSEIIKDDIESVIANFSSDIPIEHYAGTGFVSKFEQGYEEALLQYVKHNVVKNDEEKIDRSINILGTLKDDFKLEEDIREIERMIAPQIKINCVTGACLREEIVHLTKADLNIVFHRGIEAAIYLEKEYGIPYVVVDYPYGIQKSNEFLEALETYFQVDFSKKKEEIETYVVTEFAKVYTYIKGFYHLPVGVYVNKAKLDGLVYFLAEELGTNVIAADKTDCNYDTYIKKFEDNLPAVLFSSTFEGGVADSLQAPLFPIEYPVLNRVSLGETPYAMGKGAVNIMNDLINMIMTLKYNEDKGAWYEKNMCIR